jgi:2,3-bisphosphoglycerate-independent phosphoglycerate mutase
MPSTIRPAKRRPRSPRSFTQARKLLADQPKANGLTLRGFSGGRTCPATRKSTACGGGDRRLSDVQGTGPAGGHGRSSARPQTLDEQIDVLEQHWDKYDFFFIHYKYTDSTGEDGNFDAKVQRIEEFDAACRGSRHCKPTVLIVTGDHSTPSMLQPQLAPGADAAGGDCCRPDACRSSANRVPARRPGAVRGQASDDAGPGQRRRLAKYGA